MKQYQSFFGLTVLFLSFQTYTISELEQQAQDWIYTYIFTKDGNPCISDFDMQCIANLVYFSWLRSAITLQAQEQALNTINIIWKGWQNIAQTRLDPSGDLPYVILPEHKNETITLFWEAVNLHKSIGMIYSYTVKMILDKQILTPLALDAVADLRNRSRSEVIASLTDIRKQLGEFFHIKSISTNDNSITLDPDFEQKECKKSTNILDYIYAYIPQLALNSFVEANELNNIVSEEGWNALSTIQEIGNKTWKAIEDARCEFYHAYYSMLIAALKKYKRPDSCMPVMFDEKGFIDKTEQHECLPDPENLTC